MKRDYKKIGRKFNEARQNCVGDIFSTEEMYTFLTSVIGFARGADLLRILSKMNIIRKIDRGVYMFPTNPVYYGKIELAIKLSHQKLYKDYYKN